MTKKTDDDELFKTLKQEVRQIEGVGGCGGSLEELIVYLEKDTLGVREAVRKVINNKSRSSGVRFINTGKISASS